MGRSFWVGVLYGVLLCLALTGFVMYTVLPEGFTWVGLVGSVNLGMVLVGTVFVFSSLFVRSKTLVFGWSVFFLFGLFANIVAYLALFDLEALSLGIFLWNSKLLPVCAMLLGALFIRFALRLDGDTNTEGP